MQRLVFSVSAVLVCAALLVAGCVAPSSTSGSVTPVATSTATISLAPLALAPADLPANVTQESGRQKSNSEVGSVAKDLGWQEGYVATYSSPGNGTTIIQTITVYPAANMPDVINLVNAGDQRETGLAYADLPLPATGPETYAFSATVNVTPTTTENSGLPISSGSSVSAQSVGYTEVIFAKGDILEVIRMSGPGTQYDTLKTLAETAYNKIG